MCDKVFTKTPMNLPKIKIKSQNEKFLESLLTPVKDMILPSDSDSDCSSVLQDPFEEFHKNSFLRPLPGTKSKYLSKREADWKTVEQFTEDFKRTMKELRKDLDLGEALTKENDQEIEKELISQEKHAFFNNAKKIVVEPISVESEIGESEATSNSAVWNMIKAHQKQYFATSPPQYDIYNPKTEHYLKRPHVAWQEIEESRKKCEKWLEECKEE